MHNECPAHWHMFQWNTDGDRWLRAQRSQKLRRTKFSWSQWLIGHMSFVSAKSAVARREKINIHRRKFLRCNKNKLASRSSSQHLICSQNTASHVNVSATRERDVSWLMSPQRWVSTPVMDWSFRGNNVSSSPTAVTFAVSCINADSLHTLVYMKNII